MAKGWGSRTSRIKTPTSDYEAVGGPFHGETLRGVYGFSTLPFRVGKGSLGRYVQSQYGKVHWERVPVKVPCPCCGTMVDEEKVNE